MEKLCKQLNIETNKVIDNSENEVEIAGSVEVKGIKGTDKRNYVVDLQGMTPRDSNYPDEDNHSCLFRPELLMLHQKFKNLEFAQERLKVF